MLRDRPKRLYCEAHTLEYSPGRCPCNPEPEPKPKRDISKPIHPFGSKASDTDEEHRLWPLRP